MMKFRIVLLSILAWTAVSALQAQTLWLDEIKVDMMESGWGHSRSNFSVEGNPLRVAGKTYARGIGTHAVSKIIFKLKGNALNFKALVGVDDEATDKASIAFFVLGDKKVLWQSGTMKKGDPAKEVEVSLKGLEKMALLVTDGGDGIDYDHADWLEARIEYRKENPEVQVTDQGKPVILTPPVSDIPKINYPRITGAGPGHPFLFTIPVTGKLPLTFEVKDLPQGLTLDRNTGIIKGTTPPAGQYLLMVTVSNELGKAEQNIKIVSGDKLALTPPMGWNSWNCWGLSVDDQKVRSAVDAMSAKLAGHGWTYVNIDDGWETPRRNDKGEIMSNEKFPDMKALGDYCHGKGLKLGIYSSPGEKTCGGFLGSWGHEASDAMTWAGWGIDYLKYDWCSYQDKALDNSLTELKKPYFVMRDALKATGRDIVYSLCQYGMGKVWEWGESVGGNLWRTTGDITDTWNSMSGIGFSQTENTTFAEPGGWNDPDMLVVGKVGWGPGLHQTKLTPDEQYTHVSLWSLLAAPLLIGCDMSQMDEFTLGLLTNDEIIGVNQDGKGKQARKVSRVGDNEVWVKELEGGSYAIGIFYTRPDAEGVAAALQWEEKVKPKKIKCSWAQLGLDKDYKVRDLWSQTDLGIMFENIEVEVPWHGVRLLKLTPAHP